MKNIYFKRTDSVFRSLQEEKIVKPKRRVNWDRLVYIVLLCTFLFFAGRYAFFKIYYVKADGQVMFQNVDIQNIEDCRIYNFQVKEGQHVRKGDTLFYFADKKYEKSANSLSANSNWQEKELILIDEEISVSAILDSYTMQFPSPTFSEIIQLSIEEYFDNKNSLILIEK